MGRGESEGVGSRNWLPKITNVGERLPWSGGRPSHDGHVTDPGSPASEWHPLTGGGSHWPDEWLPVGFRWLPGTGEGFQHVNQDR